MKWIITATSRGFYANQRAGNVTYTSARFDTLPEAEEYVRTKKAEEARRAAALKLAADLEKLAHDMDPFGYDADDARGLVDDITAGNIEYIADGLATIAADDCNDFAHRARAAELLARLLRMFA